ncbi:hypothetical protein NO559_06680 [Dasania sp. GY-MA-18]|uniref:Rubredoxin n=1 Tax=Dasania phycosphaerae TaxID=2950436 RepID=A0A9J6RJM0_9GAMM|nr:MULTISPECIES: hypothetical protein [Dasania]MCR8922450.1 hypothetical protein [Dasania sp. GY-MA-18]MCZ0864878.1 hypothetical protein [Dasania phycosphaerae]MCZ0868606.1 hypothetical protein [Dasania phycosphaerae]
MLYQCADCSYKGKTFNSGACPACGSNNIKRSQPDAPQAEAAKPKPYRLIAALVLWLIFMLELYKKLAG